MNVKKKKKKYCNVRHMSLKLFNLSAWCLLFMCIINRGVNVLHISQWTKIGNVKSSRFSYRRLVDCVLTTHLERAKEVEANSILLVRNHCNSFGLNSPQANLFIDGLNMCVEYMCKPKLLKFWILVFLTLGLPCGMRFYLASSCM